MSEPTTSERLKPQSLLTEAERSFRLSPEEAANINAKARIRLVGVVHGQPFSNNKFLEGWDAPTPLEYQGIEDEVRKLKPARGDAFFMETGGNDSHVEKMLEITRRHLRTNSLGENLWALQTSREMSHVNAHMYGAELATLLGIPAYGADIGEERLKKLMAETGMSPAELNHRRELRAEFCDLRTYQALQVVIQKAQALPAVASPEDRPIFLVQWGAGHFGAEGDNGTPLPDVFTQQGLEIEAEVLPNNMDERMAHIQHLANLAINDVLDKALDAVFAKIDADWANKDKPD
jgi:hypothetical protein